MKVTIHNTTEYTLTRHTSFQAGEALIPKSKKEFHGSEAICSFKGKGSNGDDLLFDLYLVFAFHSLHASSLFFLLCVHLLFLHTFPSSLSIVHFFFDQY
jgi:hypothetical protein